MRITDPQAFSRRLDVMIAGLLAQKSNAAKDGRKKVRVVITGEDLKTLPLTLNSLRGLDNAGYQLLLTFSHSASESGLRSACLREVEAYCTGARFDEQAPLQDDEDDSSLFLPALSTNSLTKIALGIRDNIATLWVFHALLRHQHVVVSLNPECLNADFAPALRTRLAEYVATLAQYGIVIAGRKTADPVKSNAGIPQPSGQKKRLISLSDIRQHHGSQALYLDRHTLITPAAQDEIRHQNITVIREPWGKYVSG